MSQILKEIQAIKKCIVGKKEKFQKSHFNFVELNKILGRSLENIKPNLLLELTAHEVLSDMKFLEIIGDVLNMVTFNSAAKYQRDSGPYSWEQKGEYKIINNK